MFHTHGNWFWKRLDDGTVHITQRKPSAGFGDGEIIAEHRLDPSSWASVVSSMSAEGETGRTYQSALDFHASPTNERSLRDEAVEAARSTITDMLKAADGELTHSLTGAVAAIIKLRAERDAWKRRAVKHGCDIEKGDPDCG